MNELQFVPFKFVFFRSPLHGLANAYKFSTDVSLLFEEGLYLASPEFWTELLKIGHLTDDTKIKRSFYKYWLRSCTRCTPFGTFAGSGLLHISAEETNINLGSDESYTRYLRLDMNYLTNLIAAITNIPEVLEQIRFFSNNSIYELPYSLRYAEYEIHNNYRRYTLTSVLKEKYIKAVLDRSFNGANLNELAQVLVDIENVRIEEAREFIINMWKSQLLISELEPCVTGNEPLDDIIAFFSRLSNVDHLLKHFIQIRNLLQNPKRGVEFYRLVETKLKELNLNIQFPKNTLQVDLFFSTNGSEINRKLVENIVDQVVDLSSLARNKVSPEIEDFKVKFLAKYDEEEIPLQIALDAEIGVGYAGINSDIVGNGELIIDIPTVRKSILPSMDFDYIVRYTLTKYQHYLATNASYITIHEDELSTFKKENSFRFSNSMFIFGSLLKRDGLIEDDKYFFDLNLFSGPSAANLLGRFTLGNRELSRLTKELLRLEEIEYPDAIYAEVAHMPQARIGNVLLRPVLREYEIPYVGKSGASSINQIPINDLYVSVKNNEVILRSKLHNKRVFPRLSTAHNFTNGSLPVYKFLCDLQGQGLAFPCIWDWAHLEILKYLPRVVYKNIIVKRARWKFDEHDIIGLPKDTKEYVNYFKTFCTKWNLPRRVIYKQADNEMLIDFSEEVGIDLFLHYLYKHKIIEITEFLFTEENCIVSDQNGLVFTNELVIPLCRDKVEIKSDENEYSKNYIHSVKRRFSINSQWVYFKVYCGPKITEQILKSRILEFVCKGIENMDLEKFFFVRYRDESPHLRIRFYNSIQSKQRKIYENFVDTLQPMLDNGLISNIVADTYTRELERYGEQTIEFVEELFFVDSLAIIKFLDMLEDNDEEYRLLFALRGIDMFLDDFGLKLDEKIDLIRGLAGSFFREFGGHPNLQKVLNSKYRNYQRKIFSYMNEKIDVDNGIDKAISIFKERSNRNKKVFRDYKNSFPSDISCQNLLKLSPDFIHMFVNRLFITQHRKYELIIYHFLEKYYSSIFAISKKSD